MRTPKYLFFILTILLTIVFIIVNAGFILTRHECRQSGIIFLDSRNFLNADETYENCCKPSDPNCTAASRQETVIECCIHISELLELGYFSKEDPGLSLIINCIPATVFNSGYFTSVRVIKLPCEFNSRHGGRELTIFNCRFIS